MEVKGCKGQKNLIKQEYFDPVLYFYFHQFKQHYQNYKTSQICSQIIIFHYVVANRIKIFILKCANILMLCLFTSKLCDKFKDGTVILWFLSVSLCTRGPNDMTDSFTLVVPCRNITRKVPHNLEDFSGNCVQIKAAISTGSKS